MSQQVNETKQIAAFLLKEIDRLIDRPVRIMEVCRTVWDSGVLACDRTGSAGIRMG